MNDLTIVAVVIALCFALKKANYIKSNLIPLVALILGLGGSVASVLWFGANMNIIQAVLIGLAPVGVHQLYSKTFKG